jgi:hypothetical protein
MTTLIVGLSSHSALAGCLEMRDGCAALLVAVGFVLLALAGCRLRKAPAPSYIKTDR